MATLFLFSVPWVFLCVIAGILARRKGRNWAEPGLLALLVGFLSGLVHVLLARREAVLTFRGEVMPETPWALLMLGVAALTVGVYAALPQKAPRAIAESPAPAPAPAPVKSAATSTLGL